MLETISLLETILNVSSAQVNRWRGTLQNKIITLDAGHGFTEQKDLFRQGPSGEREEYINLRVVHYLSNLLKLLGAHVIFTRTQNTEVELNQRAQMAVAHKSNIFVSIHHNAAYPHHPEIDYPCVFFHGNNLKQVASFHLAHFFAAEFNQVRKQPALIASDQFIYQNGFSVLRELAQHNIPAIISEFSFFSHQPEEEKLKNPHYNQMEAAACTRAIAAFFEQPEGNLSTPAQSEVNPIPFDWLQQLKAKHGILFSELSSLQTFDLSVLNQSEELWKEGGDLQKAGKWAEAINCYEKSLIWLANPPYLKKLLTQLKICYLNLDQKQQGQQMQNFLTHFMAVVGDDI